jgi:hypothetical protein
MKLLAGQSPPRKSTAYRRGMPRVINAQWHRLSDVVWPANVDGPIIDTFLAGDSSSMGSGIAVIKPEDRERKIIYQANVMTASKAASEPTLQKSVDGGAIK